MGEPRVAKVVGFRAATLLVAVGLFAQVPALAKQEQSSARSFPGEMGAISLTRSTTEGSLQLDVWRMEPDGFNAVVLTGGSSGNDSLPAWSADGTEIAFVSTRDGNFAIYKMNASGNREMRLTTNTELDTEPAWFPSGTRIVFRRGAGSQVGAQAQADLYVITLDESGNPSGEPKRLTTHAKDDIEPAVSPDGKRIAFASNRDGDYDIYVMKAKPEGPKNVPVRLTKNSVEEGAPDWSPDGRRLVFESHRDGGDPEIVVMNADGTKPKQLTKNDVDDWDPTWAPNGKQIAYESQQSGVFRDIFRMRADGTHKVNLTENNSIEANAAWQPR